MIETTHSAPAVEVRDHALIEARGVSVELRGYRALSEVDLQCHVGELIALVGPNGAGKSTLLHALAGDLQPSTGMVLMDGRPLASFKRVEAARLRGVLPQQSTVAFPFTVDDVVRMGRAPWRGTRDEALDDEVIANALADAGIEHLAPREYTSLSGGERARVSFARLLAQHPTLLLLDEPTAALDIRYQERLLSVVRRRVEAGGCAVVVMHDLGLAGAYADRVALLSRGTLAAAGAPGEVLRPALLSAVYEHDVTVLAHPLTGSAIVVPTRTEGSDRE